MVEKFAKIANCHCCQYSQVGRNNIRSLFFPGRHIGFWSQANVTQTLNLICTNLKPGTLPILARKQKPFEKILSQKKNLVKISHFVWYFCSTKWRGRGNMAAGRLWSGPVSRPVCQNYSAASHGLITTRSLSPPPRENSPLTFPVLAASVKVLRLSW